MTNYDIIKDAILHKKQVFATYNGYYREMCPHVIGTKRGVSQALFYQFGGKSSRGKIIPGSEKNWRCIPVDKLVNVSSQYGAWHSHSPHTQRQTCVDIIDVQVHY